MIEICFNIGYEGFTGSGIFNKFPIFYQVDSFKEFSSFIRDQAFEWVLWAHDSYVSKSSLCFYLNIWEKTDDDCYWNWEFTIRSKNIREFQPFIKLSREEIEEMKIQKAREDKLQELLNFDQDIK